MALFGRADRDLPLLTQVAQVDTGNDAELREFWARLSAQNERGAYANMRVRKADYLVDGPIPTQEHEIEVFLDELDMVVFANYDSGEMFLPLPTDNIEPFFTVLARKRAQSMSNLYMNKFRQFCDAIQAILLALVDRGTIPVAAKRRIDTYLQKSSVRICLLDNADDKDVEVPIEAFVARPGLDDPLDVTPLLAAETENFLYEVWREAAILQRCAECTYPFILLRKGQKYCSHRCADRVGARRRRHEKQQTA